MMAILKWCWHFQEVPLRYVGEMFQDVIPIPNRQTLVFNSMFFRKKIETHSKSSKQMAKNVSRKSPLPDPPRWWPLCCGDDFAILECPITGWLVAWKYFIFHNIWDNPSNWLIFFKLVKTTNQLVFGRENGWKGIREQNHWWSTNLFPGRMAVKLCNVRVSIGLSSQVMLPLN